MNELDERYHVAEEAIFDTFLLLLKEKELEKITVADIIKRAGIVRSTFYNHYDSIHNMIVAFKKKSLDDIFHMMESFQAKNDKDICYSYFLSLCNYTRENPFLGKLLSSPEGDDFFEEAMTMFHQYVVNVSSNNKSQQSKEFSYMLASAIGSTVGILHKWSHDGFDEPAERIAEILTKIFMAGTLPFLCR